MTKRKNIQHIISRRYYVLLQYLNQNKAEYLTGSGNIFGLKLPKRVSGWQYFTQVNMSPRLKVSNFVVQRFAKLEEGSFGFLLGISDKDTIYVLGLSKQFNSTDESAELNNYDIVTHLPSNISICGVFNVFTKEETNDNIISDLCKNVEGTPMVISFDLTSKKLTSYKYEEGRLKSIEHAESDLSKLYLHLRLTSTIPLSCDFQSECVQEELDKIHQKIIDGHSAFHIENSDVYILGHNSSDISGISSDITLEKLYSEMHLNGNINSENGINVLNVSLYLKGTNNDRSPQLAPLVKYVKKIYKHVGVELSLDSLSIAPYQLTIKQLYPMLVESVCRNLKLNKKCLLSQLKSDELRKVSLPVTYHFLPPACGHFVSIVYPAKQTPEELRKFRETFHLLLALPMDKPIFRQANAFDFSQEEKSSKNLILNPHESLSKSGVPDGEPCLVQGTYAYHHYMQDDIDDNGWGCAYRSLQTIFSWYRFQGYTNMPVPTHREIQQCLVNIGDKPGSFVGSKQWIGSTEVSFVLDTMLGVTCRIVSVSSGEEISEKGGELSYHFKTQGTPIMIGGGALAHTILGVDYSKRTGAIKFLILDPHYTGGEDLKIIQSKGWCGWKGPEFWKKDAFYNMCLPLRPKCV